MRIATFNVQNLRLREDAGAPHFDGARDKIMPLSKLSAEARALDAADRALTARLIADANADVLALQEVFDQRTLDAFHDAHLAPLGARYPHRICLPGNDGRRHVALMSRLPLEGVQSHAALSYAAAGLTPPEGAEASAPVFRRDCLAAICGGVQLYVVHFKAPADPMSLAVVRREACAVRTLIERRFADPAAAFWLILGDVNVNDVPSGHVLDVLTADFAHDLAAALPAPDRWTYFNAGSSSYARPDRMLASPALAARCRALEVRREGISRAAEAHAGPRLAGVGPIRPRASDHALLLVDIDRPAAG
ncbi:MAG TPA: endonuclease/exonuclease/phosphatase family protein [Vitreimonas sp.]|uniref:endonuclease/exonuclease/phosphatase family protein n=1 Tax=Vitreimonas sp. TaxID=3069702 RepID=UPI002D28CBFD|nr:endonuclease/exonuclease/phosphatase family protein [Vitreimonas sp.]HYD88429.1 endonuclease/exonuclease/phosphatase family protein [Vitreimonas sp.]